MSIPAQWVQEALNCSIVRGIVEKLGNNAIFSADNVSKYLAMQCDICVANIWVFQPFSCCSFTSIGVFCNKWLEKARYTKKCQRSKLFYLILILLQKLCEVLLHFLQRFWNYLYSYYRQLHRIKQNTSLCHVFNNNVL